MKWISVNQELPRACDLNGEGISYSDEVLVVHTESLLNRRAVCAAIMRGSMWFDRWNDALDDVELWSPMPAPPIEEK